MYLMISMVRVVDYSTDKLSKKELQTESQPDLHGWFIVYEIVVRF